MQKKKARKGFLFLRRESVLPPCRAGPVCPAGTNAVCVGRDTWVPPYAPCHCAPVCAAKQVPLGYRLARQSVSPQRKGRIPTPVTRSLARNDSAAARQRPLDKSGGMGIIINRRGRCDKRSAPCKIGNLRIRNRHLAEWRFRLFSF